MADGTEKAIEQVRAGEVVASFDPRTGMMVAARVIVPRVHGPETSEAGFVVLHGPSGTLRVTPNHPLFIDGVAKRADTFRAGSRIMTPGARRNTPASLGATVLDLNVRSVAVTDVELAPGNGESTYDLEVEGPGTFFASNILVRRKRIP